VLSERSIPPLVKALIAVLAIEVIVAGLNLALPPDMSRAEQASAVALDDQGDWLRALPIKGGTWRIRADLALTDKSYIDHLLKMEDERFYEHQGIDARAIMRALLSNIHAGSVVSGGSTITMQMAKLLEPKSRTFGAKVIEACRALQLELRYSKSDILSLYLTLAPYGGNLEGVRAASLSYFGHEPESLTLGEQALLIALPQSPEARRPDRHPKAAKAARDFVLWRLQTSGAISQQQYQEAQSEPIPTKRIGFPSLAWHLAGRLASQAKGLDASIHTTLNARLQRRLEGLAREVAKQQGPASSVAIIVVEIKTRAVKAWIGSAGLDREGGWVDMGNAIRSPGSTLKPFIYGMGFDDGVIAPETRLMDAPTRFGDYQPEDFDKVFHGEVSVKEALIGSLNVPAVSVLNKIGASGFEARIEGAGVALRRPKSGLSDAGLALALGGVGVKLSDLVTLYAGLGDKGLIKPLIYEDQQMKLAPYQLGYRLLSESSATKVMNILRETSAPAGRLPAALMKVSNRPAFKTGTSYGFRDALALGVAGGYAVLVWTGRPDGGARADMTGREASAPLLFDVFDQLNTPSNLPNHMAPPKAPDALITLKSHNSGPTLLFPPNGATLYVTAAKKSLDGRLSGVEGLKLAARGQGQLRWYVAGEPLISGDDGMVWQPPSEGFYELSVVDDSGKTTTTHVRVKAIEGKVRP